MSAHASGFPRAARRSTWLAAAIAATLVGCASAPNPADMKAHPRIAKQHTDTVAIAATSMLEGAGGPLSISGAAITDAITASVDETKLFSRVVQRGDAQYLLSAVLVTSDTPMFGISFTATCEMGWTLAKADGPTVWKEILKTEGTATGGEAFAGVARARMARERAIRENITRALTKVGELDF